MRGGSGLHYTGPHARAPGKGIHARRHSRFREILVQHTRLLTRVKNASEGIIRAVAEEVDRKKAQARPYKPGVANTPRPASALVYNSVI